MAEEHTTISPVVGDTEFFSAVPGSLGVLIKDGSGNGAQVDTTPAVNNQPEAFSQDLTVTSLETLTITLDGFDLDGGNTLSWLVVEIPDPAKGTLSETSGLIGVSLVYSNIGGTGTDVFTFQVNDGTDSSNAISNPATIIITIE